MKEFNNTKIIGIDHGYGNMKTANFCFPTGHYAPMTTSRCFTADMLVFGGRYYLIGEGHKEFVTDKIKDEDYYVLTLVAIAKELQAENITERRCSYRRRTTAYLDKRTKDRLCRLPFQE